MYCVYILRTVDDTLYIGVSGNLRQRIASHNSGKWAEWIQGHPGARLVFAEPHPTLSSARRRENQLKRWTRVKKEALIAGDLAVLKNFSRCKSVIGSR